MKNILNDMDLNHWKEYSDIETDSLWIMERRDNSGLHSGDYHGNFIPQIPYQLFSRFTRKGDWILDPFMGSGTSLIEAQRMGRNAIGIEIQSELAETVRKRLESVASAECLTQVVVDDCTTVDLNDVLAENKIQKVQFLIFHPPYWDIIKFSSKPNDLSNLSSLEDFLKAFGKSIDNCSQILEDGRYCALVMGDKYANGQVVPLGFECMNLFLTRGFCLKGIVVKNFGETKGKGKASGIWRYRALANGFYVFKHEYVFVFKKGQGKSRA